MSRINERLYSLFLDFIFWYLYWAPSDIKQGGPISDGRLELLKYFFFIYFLHVDK